MNLLAQAPKLFLLLQKSDLIHVRQIESVQVAPATELNYDGKPLDGCLTIAESIRTDIDQTETSYQI